MNKVLGFTLLVCLLGNAAYSQHYYNDLIMTNDIIKKRALYQLNKVRSVKMTSFDNYNQKIDGFEVTQSVAASFATITTTTNNSLNGKDETTHYFNAQGQLTKSVDTTDGNKLVIQYTYDAENQITGIVSLSLSPGGYSTREQHLWFYKAGKPEKMLKIKNGTDTTVITYNLDEKGNLAEEKSVHNGLDQPTVYYYYDDKSRLTDIVRYNARVKRLLPDYVFEYDTENRLSMMLVTTQGGADYQKWYYKYNEKGMKKTDECYAKSKMLIAKVEYVYQ